ncbi:helix-turn-helix domain-containing protein [Microbacterium sp. gxy059]|uniref:helix-turn-helix domain-containing protein n=1 Tax=Microbacterium sp. gxy059 TaxID=2957199 RepID=UPI003D982A7A
MSDEPTPAASGPQSRAERDEPRWMTAEMLKALAHPLRQELLRLLRRREHVRAADASAELGEPANKISFHLRVLADAGLIVEAPEQARDRRDRVWTATKGALTLGDADRPVADEALGGAVMRALVDEHMALVRRVAAWAPGFVSGRASGMHGTFTQSYVKLTGEEFEALMERIHAEIHAATEAHAPDAPGTQMYSLDIVAGDDTL